MSLRRIGTVHALGRRRAVFFGSRTGDPRAGAFIEIGGGFRAVSMTAVMGLPGWRRETDETHAENLLLAIYGGVKWEN